jgi:hypothetical protein
MSILKFTAYNHKYTSDDNKEWMSVTSVISNFKQPFEADSIALKSSKNKKSKWYGMTPEEIKEAWKTEAKRATDLGTWYDTDIQFLFLSLLRKKELNFLQNKS